MTLESNKLQEEIQKNICESRRKLLGFHSNLIFLILSVSKLQGDSSLKKNIKEENLGLLIEIDEFHAHTFAN